MFAMKFIALLAAALLSIAAMADEGGDKEKGSMKSAEQKFESLDKNRDRQISKSEATKDETLSTSFAALDADSDGYVSEREYTAKMSTGDEQSQKSDQY